MALRDSPVQTEPRPPWAARTSPSAPWCWRARLHRVLLVTGVEPDVQPPFPSPRASLEGCRRI